MPSTLKSDFSLISQLHDDWLDVIGGELAGANQGCGTMLSGESLYFYQVSLHLVFANGENTDVKRPFYVFGLYKKDLLVYK